MLDVNGIKVEKDMLIEGILKVNCGIFMGNELEILIKKGTLIQGVVVKDKHKLCVQTKGSIGMPFVSALQKDTRKILSIPKQCANCGLYHFPNTRCAYQPEDSNEGDWYWKEIGDKNVKM